MQPACPASPRPQGWENPATCGESQPTLSGVGVFGAALLLSGLLDKRGTGWICGVFHEIGYLAASAPFFRATMVAAPIPGDRRRGRAQREERRSVARLVAETLFGWLCPGHT